MNTGTNYAELFYSKIDNDIHTLEKNVSNYPASSIAQFLLLYHQKKNNQAEFNNLAKQKGIYFNNPLWIGYQLSQLVSADEDELVIVAEDLPENVESETIPTNETEIQMGTSEVDLQENLAVSEELIEPEQTDENISNHENEIKINEEVEIDAEAVSQNPDLKTFDSINAEEPVTIETKEETEEEESVSFEPLHTVDYFASQGIKISEESLGNDELSKQVKSFTGWLKSMKKLHPDQTPQQNDVIEKIIQSSAEASNAEANVLTEAMAEVLIKQNKKEKAVEMYEKLSLINPSKSAYFAAKIESLKTL
jgi:hypothetical protein